MGWQRAERQPRPCTYTNQGFCKRGKKRGHAKLSMCFRFRPFGSVLWNIVSCPSNCCSRSYPLSGSWDAKPPPRPPLPTYLTSSWRNCRQQPSQHSTRLPTYLPIYLPVLTVLLTLPFTQTSRLLHLIIYLTLADILIPSPTVAVLPASQHRHMIPL